MSEFTCRKADRADFSLILEAKKQSLLEEREWDGKMISLLTEGFADAAERGALTAYLAFRGGEFAGMGAMLILRGETTLCDFYVFPKYRRQGAMHELMGCLIQEARERGCDRALLIAKEEYREHWQAHGFKDLYEENDDGETVLSTRMEMLLN